jgi:hypothetical protein
MTIRSVHRHLVDAIARRTGLTGEPLQNRPRHLSNPGPRPGAGSGHALVSHHDPSRRRVLVRWQGLVGSWVGGRRP